MSRRSVATGILLGAAADRAFGAAMRAHLGAVAAPDDATSPND